MARECEMCRTMFLPRGSRGPKPKFCRPCVAIRMLEASRRHVGFVPADQRKCRDCGVLVGRPKRRFCEDCFEGHEIRRRTARRILERVAPGESFSRREIFERDGWICGICGDAVPEAWESRSPTSPSIDHIVPLSRGGEHTRANVQLAHLRCNLSKGVRLLDEARAC